MGTVVAVVDDVDDVIQMHANLILLPSASASSSS